MENVSTVSTVDWTKGMTLGVFKALMLQLFAVSPMNDLEFATAFIETMMQKLGGPTATDDLPIPPLGSTPDGFDCVIGDRVITLRRTITGPVRIVALASGPFMQEPGVHGKRFHLVKAEDPTMTLINFGSHSHHPSAILLDSRSEIVVRAGEVVKLQGPPVPVVLFYRTGDK